MTKTTEGLHYIYDEALQCEREYEEVSGEASVGDTILMVDHAPLEIEAGTVLTITDKTDFDARYDKYIKLAPTGNVRLSTGEIYTLADRKAAVGEKIISLGTDRSTRPGYEKGDVFTVTHTGQHEEGDGSHAAGFTDNNGCEARAFWDVNEYRVLDPVESAEPTQACPQESPRTADELLANLVRRMSSVEKTLGYDQFGPGKLPELAGKVSENHHAINALEETVNLDRKENDDFAERVLEKFEALTQEMTAIRNDLQTFAEVSEEAKHQAQQAKQKADNADWKAEVLFDDVVSLDERTQPEALAETVAEERDRMLKKRSFIRSYCEAADNYKRKGGCV